MAEISETNVNHHASSPDAAIDDEKKPALELYVKASGLDSTRIGACIFCQEFWIELYALHEINVVKLDVKVVNVNSETYKKRFLGEQAPILVETKKGITYSDNSDIEKKIFHLANDCHIPLFEKDPKVAKLVDTLYRNFKIFLRAKIDHDKMGRPNTKVEGFPPPLKASYDKLIDQLSSIDEILGERKTLYLLGNSMTEYDASLMPRLHH
uniref:GST N-terminal domain-containing protein n=1 Tax=Panagrolaimus sp. ES5 TaxID=591445 RepID=A0AC34FWU5_9BILA